MIEHLTSDRYRESGWKNGGGVTREIAAEVGVPPLWRLSVATIERDGPFSDYAGYDRTIVALDGTIELTIDGESHLLAPHAPLSFAGEATASCRVHGGPAHDLNVMTARAHAAHDVEIVTGRSIFLVDDDELVFIYALDGAVSADGLACAAGETLAAENVERIAIETDPGAHACVVRITPR